LIGKRLTPYLSAMDRVIVHIEMCIKLWPDTLTKHLEVG
jgi:hypothetical protein